MFDSLLHFLNMGGYAFYVWPAYFIVFVFLLANVIISKRKFHQIKQQIKEKR